MRFSRFFKFSKWYQIAHDLNFTAKLIYQKVDIYQPHVPFN